MTYTSMLRAGVCIVMSQHTFCHLPHSLSHPGDAYSKSPFPKIGHPQATHKLCRAGLLQKEILLCYDLGYTSAGNKSAQLPKLANIMGT